MRPASILDWLAIIAAIEFAQFVVSTATVIVVYNLFTKHDLSVLSKLDALFGPLQGNHDNETSTLDAADAFRVRLRNFLWH